LRDINFDLLYSSTLVEGTNTLQDFHTWFSERIQLGKFEVDLTPLDSLKGWAMDSISGTYGHESGKFFTINGLHVELEVNGDVRHWTQLIVNQSEQGILGLLAKRIDGVIHVLIQAKMEPGNIGFIQISPTVQATRSNYTRVHGGKSPKFIEYFLGKVPGITIFNQLRSEQGSRYYRKRNQNIVILLEDDTPVPEDKNFFWLTLGQLRELHKVPNLVHLDCRSIVGGMPFAIPAETNSFSTISTGNMATIASLHCNDSDALHSQRDLLSWFTKEKMKNIKHTKLVSIDEAKDWTFDGISIKHDSGRFFDIIGVEVHSPGREVASWSQPLIQCADGGIIGLIAQVHNGVLHFLIHARFEAGFIGSVELAPTVQFTPKNYETPTNNQTPCFIDYFEKDTEYEMLVDTFLSNEGGRFFKSQNRHMVVKIPNSEHIVVPESYAWMTLSQLYYFGSMELTLNVELRSLIFCLTFT
jgi:oxidase EvaA